jgi:hypothetical protein
MRLRNKVAAGVASVIALIGGTTAAAHAATTYTPSGQGVNFVGTNISLKNIEADQTIVCSTFNMSGSAVNSGASRSYGAIAITLSGITIAGCTNPLAGPVAVTPIGSWGLAITGDRVGTKWPARITNVAMSLNAAGCKFSIGGMIDGTFDPTPQQLTPKSGASGLTITDIPPPSPGSSQAICATLDLVAGDHIAVGGSWTNTGPALNIATP